MLRQRLCENHQGLCACCIAGVPTTGSRERALQLCVRLRARSEHGAGPVRTHLLSREGRDRGCARSIEEAKSFDACQLSATRRSGRE